VEEGLRNMGTKRWRIKADRAEWGSIIKEAKVKRAVVGQEGEYFSCSLACTFRCVEFYESDPRV
jgi:hypothetical protein